MRCTRKYRADFLRAYRAALEEAAASFELGGGHEVVEHWRARAGKLPPDDKPTEATESGQ